MSSLPWTERLRRQLDITTPKIEPWGNIGKAFIAGQRMAQINHQQAATVMDKTAPVKPADSRPIGKGKELAARIKAAQAAHHRELDKIASKLDEAEKAAPAAYEAAEKATEKYKADVDDLLGDIRAQSNE